MTTVIDLPEPRLVDRRFVAMLGLSLAIHAGVLAWNRAPRETLTPAQVLTATLRMVMPVATPAPTPAAEAKVSKAAPELLPVRETRPVRRMESTAPTVALSENPRPSADSPVVPAPPAPVVAVAEPPPPPPKALPSQASLLDAYGRQLANLLSRHQEYPRLAAMRGWEGDVMVRLRVARKGNLLGVEVDRSSGFEVLDRHALTMLEHMAGLPPLPDGVEGGEIQVVVPVSYRLKKAS